MNRQLSVFVAAFMLVGPAFGQDSRRWPRIYDLRDLLAEPSKDWAATRPVEDEDHPFCRAIRAFLRPPIDADSRLSMSYGAQFFASVTEAQHESLIQIFEGMRRRPPTIFRVETQFVMASVDQAAKIGIENGSPVYVGDDGALAIVRDKIAAMSGAFIGPIESSDVVNGKPGREELSGELTYVKAYEKHVNVEPGNRTLVVPVIATEREGTTRDVLVVALPDNRIGCLLKAILARIDKPVGSRETPDGPVAAPVVTKIAIEAQATFDGKMTIIFPGPARDGWVPFVLAKVVPAAAKDRTSGR
jgi:hypothetical protein